jgi:hypothetical protein
MYLDPAVFYPAVERLIAARTPPEPNRAIGQLIQGCAAAQPHRGWAALRALDYGAELPRLRAWFDQMLTQAAPGFPVRGLYFELCHPVLAKTQASGAPWTAQATTDLSLTFYGAYDRTDPKGEWLSSDLSLPAGYAGSQVLRALYDIAYGVPATEGEDDTHPGNGAEWPVGLAYGAITVRSIVESRALATLSPDLAPVGIALGWSGGDVQFLGEVTSTGFVPGMPRRA